MAELVSAMAAGWKAQLIVETWSEGGPIATSRGLGIARGHTSGRHVCVVPDERSKVEYCDRMGEAGVCTEVMVGEAEEVMEGLVGIDFMVVDCKGREFSKILRVAKLSSMGAVLVCKNANSRNVTGFKWRSVVDGGSSRRRLVHSVFLPVGKGLDIAHVSAVGGGDSVSGIQGKRWIKHVDRQSGDVHVIRR